MTAPTIKPVMHHATFKTTRVQEQDRGGAGLARQASPLQAALYAHLVFLARLFAEITRQRIRRSTFARVTDLEAAITDWIDARNSNPKPFAWTAKARNITKHRRATKALAILSEGCK